MKTSLRHSQHYPVTSGPGIPAKLQVISPNPWTDSDAIHARAPARSGRKEATHNIPSSSSAPLPRTCWDYFSALCPETGTQERKHVPGGVTMQLVSQQESATEPAIKAASVKEPGGSAAPPTNFFPLKKLL